ncbi:Alpha/Beta hydrolase protein [Stachybotrys elegans]|uniref:Alpha/Beta hydrolase protein n=1 Tax=Stachybotrys elegans TaxID=80388 RepID=A0A8K0SHC1_9HYPO|nr:Alpha/Beta hydrolase protein [Stachybotrys elegans]
MQLTAEWLALEEKWGYRPTISGTLEELRAGYQALSDTLQAQENQAPDPSVTTRDQVIYGGLTVRIYTPKQVSEQGQRLPLGVYAHGGGFTVGGLDTYFEDRLCRYIAQHAPCVLVSVGYRRAPEYPVPSQLYDYVGAYNWAWENVETLGGDKKKMFAIGASCGGGLAIGLALKYLEHGIMAERVKGVVALAPMTIHPEHVPDKYRSYLKSWEENNDGPIVDYKGMLIFQSINGSTAQKKNPDVFPALHERLAELPPTYIATCGADVIRDDGTIIKAELDKNGVPCKLDNYDALPHFFWMYPEIKEGADFRANAASAVNWVLEQSRSS